MIAANGTSLESIESALPALSATGVSVAIDGATILNDVALKVGDGEMVGLIGPNGSGKTTLLRALAGLLPAAGRVLLNGNDLGRLNERAVARLVARVPQSGPSDLPFTAEELVLTGRTGHLGRFAVETLADRKAAWAALRSTDTAELEERVVSTLSGGERQRVYVARAVAQEAPIMLLDEPTASLDLAHQLRVLDLARSLVDGGMAAVAAIHDLELASRYCDRLVLLDRGRVVAEGPPAEVITPELLATVYGTRAIVERHPHVRGLRVTALGPVT